MPSVLDPRPLFRLRSTRPHVRVPATTRRERKAGTLKACFVVSSFKKLGPVEAGLPVLAVFLSSNLRSIGTVGRGHLCAPCYRRSGTFIVHVYSRTVSLCSPLFFSSYITSVHRSRTQRSALVSSNRFIVLSFLLFFFFPPKKKLRNASCCLFAFCVFACVGEASPKRKRVKTQRGSFAETRSFPKWPQPTMT